MLQTKHKFNQVLQKYLGPFPQSDKLWDKACQAAQSSGLAKSIDKSSDDHASAFFLMMTARQEAIRIAPTSLPLKSDTLVAGGALWLLFFLCLLLWILVMKTGIYEIVIRPAIDDAIRKLGGKEKTKKLLMNWASQPMRRMA